MDELLSDGRCGDVLVVCVKRTCCHDQFHKLVYESDHEQYVGMDLWVHKVATQHDFLLFSIFKIQTQRTEIIL